jgi:hypothetical protein
VATAEDLFGKAAFDMTPIPRDRQLYNRELKKGVQLGRKLGAYEKRFGKLRSYITNVCNQAILLNGLSPTSQTVRAYRNAVRLMKGKNPL